MSSTVRELRDIRVRRFVAWQSIGIREDTRQVDVMLEEAIEREREMGRVLLSWQLSVSSISSTSRVETIVAVFGPPPPPSPPTVFVGSAP